MADWLLDGDPGMDLWEMDVRRFGRQYRSPSYTLARVTENYETYYDIKYPGHERQSGRPLRMSPAYPAHREAEAEFGEKSGWERVNFYWSNEPAGDDSRRPLGWAGKLWSPAIEAEHRATREHAGLFDETSFGKLEVSGPGAADLLERLCDNTVARGPGRIVYTQMLNARGGIECDVTVTQIDAGTFQIVTGTAFAGHDLAWIRRHAPRDGSVLLRDVTSARTCFGLWGPAARDILQPLTPQPLDSESFPYLTMRETTVGSAPVRMSRVTFVGELGWELYAPTEYGALLWAELVEAGEPHGMRRCGYKAIDSLRAEKGYRYWGSDVTPDETPYEGGTGILRADGQGGLRRPRGAGGGRSVAGPAAGVPHPRGPAAAGARERTGARGRSDGRPCHQRCGRLLGRELDRVRLPAGRPGAAGHGRRGAGLRRVGRRDGGGRAALRPQGRAHPRLTCRDHAGSLHTDRGL